jgi:AraC-like DNA-binding protein
MHGIRLIRPAPQLRGCVRFYAQREVQIQGAAVVFPVPARAAPLLEFVFGDRIEVSYRPHSLVLTCPRAVVVGLQTHCRVQLRLQGTIECFVILFQPTGLHRLFSIPMHELADRDYEAHSVLGAFVSQLEQRLGECRSFRERARVADQFLLRRALDVRGCDGISAAASQILLGGGGARIAALADSAGLSMRQFERGFIEQVGIRPKLYARIARFEAALDSKARSSTKSWTDVAHEWGYYDQMHMVHDFGDLTGETPTSMLSRTEMVFREQIEAMRSARSSADANGNSRLIL